MKVEAEWIADCETLANQGSQSVDLDAASLRDRLAAANTVMLSAPLNIAKSYEEIPEAELQLAANQHEADIEAHGLHWPNRYFNKGRAFRDLAVHIRATDSLLWHYDQASYVRRSDPTRHWLAPNQSCFVIPMRRPRRFDASKGQGFRAGYSKRGTLHHRIVPATLAGLSVTVLTSGTLRQRPDLQPICGGAAAFPSLELDHEMVANKFRVTEARAPDKLKVITAQIDALSKCHFIVWPELTLNDSEQNFLSSTLQARSLNSDDMPALIVAGSWHRVDETGEWRNLAPLLDGHGRTIGSFSKIIKYADKTLGFEAVEYGSRFVVVVSDECIATVCICKDFCDMEHSPWAALSVDIVLVASMGEETTMKGHLTRADELRKGHGRRAFIVQQGLWNHDANPTNFFLSAPNEVPADPKNTQFLGPYDFSTISE